jgi:hypothetical protein
VSANCVHQILLSFSELESLSNKDDISKSGNWWLPGKQEKQFHGELNFSKTEGGTLLLSDTFDKENQVIMDLYFGVMYNTQTYLSNNFLMLFTACEAYHGAFLNKNSSKRERKVSFSNTYNERIDKSNLTEDDKEAIKKWAKQKGQLVAKEKIEEIYEQFHYILPFLSMKIGDKKDFIDKIIDYRNKLTHGSRMSIKKEANDLFWQYKNLQLMLQLCILTRIGFDNEQIRKIYLLDKMVKTQ